MSKLEELKLKWRNLKSMWAEYQLEIRDLRSLRASPEWMELSPVTQGKVNSSLGMFGTVFNKFQSVKDQVGNILGDLSSFGILVSTTIAIIIAGLGAISGLSYLISRELRKIKALDLDIKRELGIAAPVVGVIESGAKLGLGAGVLFLGLAALYFIAKRRT